MSGWVVRHGSCVEQELHESKSQGGVGKALTFLLIREQSFITSRKEAG